MLVILGLLVGGILAGQSLIRASELRAVTTENARYLTATHAFSDKYLGLPGDIINATSIWSGTGNGDGDGSIAIAGSEQHRYWQQLALAGLLEGTYTGASSGGGVVPGINSPTSKLPGAGWGIASWPNFIGSSNSYALDYRNTLSFGAPLPGNTPQTAILKPEEAWNIDIKIDDGNPAAGKVLGRFWNNACAVADDGTSANNDLTASYKLSDSTVQCALFFNKQF